MKERVYIDSCEARAWQIPQDPTLYGAIYTSFVLFSPLGYLFHFFVSAFSHFSLFTHSLTSGVKTSV